MSSTKRLENWIKFNESIQKQVKNHEIQEIIRKNLDCYRVWNTNDPQNLLKSLSENIKTLIKVKLNNEEDLKKGKILE